MSVYMCGCVGVYVTDSVTDTVVQYGDEYRSVWCRGCVTLSLYCTVTVLYCTVVVLYCTEKFNSVITLQNTIVSHTHTMRVELRAISDICCLRIGNSSGMHIHACIWGVCSAICIWSNRCREKFRPSVTCDQRAHVDMIYLMYGSRHWLALTY